MSPWLSCPPHSTDSCMFPTSGGRTSTTSEQATGHHGPARGHGEYVQHYIYIHTYAHVHVHTHTHTLNTYMYAHIHTHKCTHTHTSTCACTQTHCHSSINCQFNTLLGHTLKCNQPGLRHDFTKRFSEVNGFRSVGASDRGNRHSTAMNHHGSLSHFLCVAGTQQLSVT